MNKILSFIGFCTMFAAVTSCGNSACRQDTEPEAYNLPVYHIATSDTSTVNKAVKKVLVISASPRKGGNTDLLCDEFARGASEVGGDVEKIFLDDYNIDYFRESYEQDRGDTTDVATDDAPMLIAKMAAADIIVLSSPVYYMNIDAQLKALMDRCYRHSGLENKEFYYITACADNDDSTAETAIFAFRGFVVCLPSPVERGMVKATGIGRKGGIIDTDYMQQAYNLGKTI